MGWTCQKLRGQLRVPFDLDTRGAIGGAGTRGWFQKRGNQGRIIGANNGRHRINVFESLDIPGEFGDHRMSDLRRSQRGWLSDTNTCEESAIKVARDLRGASDPEIRINPYSRSVAEAGDKPGKMTDAVFIAHEC